MKSNPIRPHPGFWPTSEEFLKGQPRKPLAEYGRFLLRLADRERVLACANSVEEMSEVAWALALGAARDGRYPEANDWLQVAQEAGLEKGDASLPPFGWSWNLHYRWKEAGKLLDGVAKDGLM